jgi:hypothetical protein
VDLGGTKMTAALEGTVFLRPACGCNLTDREDLPSYDTRATSAPSSARMFPQPSFVSDDPMPYLRRAARGRHGARGLIQNAASRAALRSFEYPSEFWQRGEALLLTGRIAVRWMVRKAHVLTQTLTAEIIAAAIDGYEFQKTRIDTKIAELRSLLTGGPTEPAVAPEAPTRKRKKFSAASRRKMAMAQKARWAKIKGEPEPSAPAPPEPAKPKRRISKAGLARIIAATKQRWARVRAAKAQQEKAARKAARKKAAVKKAAPAKAAKKSAPVKKAAVKTVPAPVPAEVAG